MSKTTAQLKPTKPSYIGLLNAIANGERGGYELFSSWSATTRNKTLKKTLDMVAIREMEHSWAFEKRLNELGYALRPSTDEAAEKDLKNRVKLLGSKASDATKFALFGIGPKANKNQTSAGKEAGKKAQKRRKKADDQLLKILSDPSIDPLTGALMGRFICEERDTGRALRAAYKACNKEAIARKK